MPSPEASRRNLEKAKANWRRPRPWRSYQETRLITRLAWQWYRSRGPKCSGRELARRLSVSHTYIQKLMRDFSSQSAETGTDTCEVVSSRAADLRNILLEERAFGSATFGALRYAQEESRKMREYGWLRCPPGEKASIFQTGNAVPARTDYCNPFSAVNHSMVVAGENKKVRPVRLLTGGSVSAGRRNGKPAR